MDQLNSRSYYLARAEASRVLAQRATDPAIAAIHEEFAIRYDGLLARDGPGAVEVGSEAANS
jgi:hypothetical protein